MTKAEKSEYDRIDIGDASRKARDGADWFGRKAAIEETHGVRRKELARRLTELEQQLSAAKHRKSQEQHRAALNAGLLRPGKNTGRGDPSTALRPDGSVDLGIAMLLLLDEVRALRIDLKQLAETRA